MKSASVVILCLVFTNANSLCSEGYSIICDNLTDVKSYAKGDWSSLIIGDTRNDHVLTETLKSDVFSKCPNLEELTIITTINKLDSNAFTGLPKLLILKLYNNSITSLSDSMFTNLPQLSKLDLQNNRIEQLTNESPLINSSLMTVNLSHNKLRKLYLDTFKTPGLQRLIMSHNEISELGPTNIFSADLVHLNLDHNHLYHIQSDVINGSKLEELLLSNNRFTTFRVKYQLIKLKILDLSHNSITIVEPGVFDGMPSLVTLHLNHNFIKALPADIFQLNFAQLRISNLFLHENRFENMEFLVRGIWPELSLLTISKNPWPCDCLDLFLSSAIKPSGLRLSFCEDRYFEQGIFPVCIAVKSEWNNGKCDLHERPYELYDNFFKITSGFSC